MGLGWVLKRAFKFPAWAIPAICFNNTTALPLLLIQSLESSGILSDLAMNGHDANSAIASRAKSYFLVSSMIGNSLTFALGPRLLDDEHAPNDEEDGKATGGGQREVHMEEEEEEYENPTNSEGRTAEGQEEYETETTTLLPNVVSRPAEVHIPSILNVSRGVRY